jgi:hypothetical protein
MTLNNKLESRLLNAFFSGFFLLAMGEIDLAEVER